MNYKLTPAEVSIILRVLEQGIIDAQRWNRQNGFHYWESRRDEMYSVYRKLGGILTLKQLILPENEPAMQA
jgi:hypothetical protein